MKNRKFAYLLLGAAALAGLTACGASTNKSSTDKNDGNTFKITTVRWSDWGESLMDRWAFAASALIFSRSADAMRVLNLISFFIINDLSEMISLVPSESWGVFKGGLVPL